MPPLRTALALGALLAGAAALAACRTPREPWLPAQTSPLRPADGEPLAGEGEGLEQAYAIAARVAQERRRAAAAQTFEEFQASVLRDPGGKYIVDGDTAIADAKQLREFFEQRIASDSSETLRGSLVSARPGVQAALWNRAQRRSLTYCVSHAFSARHAAVVAALEEAARAWEQVAVLDFAHAPSQDAGCSAANAAVVFDVRPVSNAGYLARAFSPNEPRSARNLLIDDASFALDPPPSRLQLAGVLRHSLGHALGFRHEQTRPEAGSCFEDDEWRPLTSYDALSVMHYPQCNGGGDWSLALTARDRNGAACVYGAAPGFAVDPQLCPDPPEPIEPDLGERARSYPSQRVVPNQERFYGPFAVKPGTRFEAQITGRGASPGDPDLYVRFGERPTSASHACRPYLPGADESCALDVPLAAAQAFVLVRGHAEGSYDLGVRHTP